MYKLRRTMMYIPGNNPGMIKDGHIYGADSIMFDLEDSVSLNEKDAARFLVHNALKSIDYEGIETVVRINGLDTCGMEDLEAIVRAQPDVIRLPKTESAQDIIDVENEIARIEKEAGIPVGKTKMMAAVEGALGVMNAREIATASKRLMGIAIGAEDYVTDLKTTRSPEGIELLFGRSQIILAARAAGIYAFDTVYSDVNNEEGFANEVKLIKQLGFDGKSVINPRQIGPVHEIYTPSQKEIDKSIRVIKAAEDAKKRGSGVVSLDGKMVDKPIIERAQRALMLAEAAGVYVNEGGDEIA
ncbi:citrate (pro-3S)-lyase subunit beta [Clostridium saccharoperbutylacetonicum]|uniref:Citrate lyase subunit beta n=1 Tax=Clostridium saccharoperbutylacetonicum N1-4(HMT) TaxID=931276 RepID=M1LWD1_9CLOT|nr:citrate (pro-3S)-lyase subunit beta [Clostridium saccharoperbutylacetonicum]AGF57500.1 citrate lyase subunit beta [Clostridium saccharoperbutylacetonicum N1-4(HMT)]AQR96192.1 citrate lyase subunit beta [Clostridium saccharoperbutylacetonicum]NRT61732.1 citrate lyase subunit beta/citryl-CoA lyase [Clostridium saccharoperbutylacetonicum]NSB25057.1 citrate lyase subunit beta/citryl-CoA lyase [Clostridium saccharoperbutylacetonicum]NSB32065.1 citrate lyase subunit beta/citryl-CoA lyase [Clostri